MTTTNTALFGLGYVLSVPVLLRFVPVVRERRWRWLATHHVGVVTLVAASALRPLASGVAINSTWLAASSLWYASGHSGRA
ncbi:MAG: hypothetical protein ACRDZW_03680 [Acidimicrobiales bacterium]